MTSCHVRIAVNTNNFLKKLNPDFFIIFCELNLDGNLNGYEHNQDVTVVFPWI